MKKKIALVVIFVFVLTVVLAGCGETLPEESQVIEKLKTVDTVQDVEAATEDNDPNKKLNKDGGYYSDIFFTSSLVDQSKIKESGPVKKGTKGGGCIEIYKTKEDAEKRNEYLKTFDGSVLGNGSHKVCETMVIRTSGELKASDQETLTNNIIEALK